MTNTASALVVRVGCEIGYETDVATPAVLLVRPEGAGHRVLEERWTTVPDSPHHDYRDMYGNACRRVTIAPGRFGLTYDAKVEISPEPAETDWNARQLPVEELPDDVLMYTLPSRFCLSDALAQTAWDLFGSAPPGWSCVQAICDWVNHHIRFQYGTSLPLTTAADVFRDGTGVCRDFAHLAIISTTYGPARFADMTVWADLVS